MPDDHAPRLTELVQQACRFNCDAESSCTCYPHQLYRVAVQQVKDQQKELNRRFNLIQDRETRIDDLEAQLAAERRQHQGWQPITTAPKGVECWFVIRPKTDDEAYTDTSGKPITVKGDPVVRHTYFGRWSGLEIATHWQPYQPPALPLGASHPPETPPKESNI